MAERAAPTTGGAIRPAGPAARDLPVAERTRQDTERYELQTRAGMLDETLKLASYSAVTHLAVAVALPILFWSSASRPFLIGLSLTVTAIIAATLYTTWLYRHTFGKHVREQSVARGYRISRILALALGLSWATMPIMLFAPADSDHRLLIVATAAGLISDIYVIGPILSVAWLFAVPLILGSFAGLARSGEPVAVSIGVLLVVYALFVMLSARRMSHLSYQRILNRVRVEDQSQTIGLLLNEFEENTSDWLWEVDRDGRFRHASGRMAQELGMSVERLESVTFAALLPSDAGPGAAQELSDLFGRHAPFRDRTVRIATSAGKRWWRLSGRPLFDTAGVFTGYRGMGSDITQSRESDERIAYLASHDILTGLQNRAAFRSALHEACQTATDAAPLGLLYLDLDGFKPVNDSAGHGVGDLLLKVVAQRLVGLLAPGEQGFRLGGDEFAILVPCIETADAESLAERVVAALGRPYRVESKHFEIGVSVGVAFAPRDATDPEALVRNADLALYSAKGDGKGRWRRFDTGLEDDIRRQRELDVEMRAALARDEMELAYQPLVNLADGRVVGFEALLRWSRPGLGPVSPAEIIPLAESTGFITAIGRWVLRRACRQAAEWPRGVRIAVNISTVQFRSPDFVEEVEAVLAETGLPPDRLEIEITESIFLDRTTAVLDNLARLRALGVRIALDDFGTGYSSLSYLIQFPVDKIKIDRSFVRDLTVRPECAAVIEAIMVIARDLSIDVTVEGVETGEQLRMLRFKGCDSGQGYLFSRPRPAADVPMLIACLPVDFQQHPREAFAPAAE